MATDYEFIEEAGVRFLVRRLTGQAYKEKARQAQQAARARGAGWDPFLPYDPALWVADLTPTHVCLLNKFAVIDHHLLVVTRAFEEQTAALTLADFHALWLCMAQIRGLGFYNAGKVAGASQRHKHLQVAPYPWAPGVLEPPTAPLIADAHFTGGVGHNPRLPFAHAIAHLDPDLAQRPREATAASYAAYWRLLQALHLAAPGQDLAAMQPPPYNLLLTREWMLLVPRRRQSYKSIAVNALGFAGSFFVRNPEQRATLKRVGPLAVLGGVGITPPASA